MALPITLIGMPGGGKSTVGRQLARQLDAPFVDTDVVIERQLGRSIRAFFEQEGEAKFRDVEAQVLVDVLGDSLGVIATGGGIVLRAANRLALHERSRCVYLRSSPEDLYRRLRHDSKRPLLQVADPLARLRELFAARDALYLSSAHTVVETGRPAIPAIVATVIARLAADLTAAASQTPPAAVPPTS